jgi:hypothetical protein
VIETRDDNDCTTTVTTAFQLAGPRRMLAGPGVRAVMLAPARTATRVSLDENWVSTRRVTSTAATRVMLAGLLTSGSSKSDTAVNRAVVNRTQAGGRAGPASAVRVFVSTLSRGGRAIHTRMKRSALKPPKPTRTCTADEPLLSLPLKKSIEHVGSAHTTRKRVGATMVQVLPCRRDTMLALR